MSSKSLTQEYIVIDDITKLKLTLGYASEYLHFPESPPLIYNFLGIIPFLSELGKPERYARTETSGNYFTLEEVKEWEDYRIEGLHTLYTKSRVDITTNPTGSKEVVTTTYFCNDIDAEDYINNLIRKHPRGNWVTIIS